MSKYIIAIISAIWAAMIGAAIYGKVEGIIAWHWWLVLAPVWVPVVAAFAALVIAVMILASFPLDDPFEDEWY